jgi:hypothetical protein
MLGFGCDGLEKLRWSRKAIWTGKNTPAEWACALECEV